MSLILPCFRSTYSWIFTVGLGCIAAMWPIRPDYRLEILIGFLSPCHQIGLYGPISRTHPRVKCEGMSINMEFPRNRRGHRYGWLTLVSTVLVHTQSWRVWLVNLSATLCAWTYQILWTGRCLSIICVWCWIWWSTLTLDVYRYKRMISDPIWDIGFNGIILG